MKTYFKTLILLFIVLSFTHSDIHSQSNQLDLSAYTLDSGPIKIQEGNTDILDLSGVTYNPLTNTLFMITNKSNTEIYETTLEGEIIRRIDLVQYTNHDPEDIVHMYGNTFAIAEEKLGRVVYVDIFPGTTSINLSNGTTNTIVQLPGSWPAGDGIEGVSYNPITDEVHAVNENTRQWYKFDESDTTPPASSLQSCTLLNSQPAGTDLAAIHHLQLTEGIAIPNRMLVLSDESNVLVEMDENCNEYSQINLPATTTGGQTQHEGVTMDSKGNIYVVGEPNELYIYSNCRIRDSLILVELYQNNGGPNWEDFPWDLNQPMDTWYGIATNANGCVTQVVLDEQGLTGTIPASLGDLEYLTHLDLFRNDLTGTIPPEFGDLSNLLYMDLNHNDLTGTIPVELGNLSNLRRLNLSSNDLTGTIPTELSNLSLLTNLSLGGNQLSGSIPPELGDLSKLLYLYLNHNKLTGTIPSQLGDLIKLRNLRLDNNKLVGQIPSELGQLANLRLLYVHRNQLSGTIPTEFGNLTKLIRLYMYTNNLSGQIPSEFGDMTNLKYLHLGYNNLTGELPGELGNLTKLIYLRIPANNLSGCYDINLYNLCGQLTSAVIDNSNSFDAKWSDFCASFAGVCYTPSSCQTIDSLALVELYHATDGDNWDYGSWDFSQPTDTWYGVAFNADDCVSGISLDEMNLTGTLPASLGVMKEMTYFDIFFNNVTGSIPATFGSLPKLINLDLNKNDLTGAIPPELGNLPAIKRIMLSSNDLTGTIPPELGNLTTIERLTLAGNQLTGEIPATFGSLPNLIVLTTSYNPQLSGCYDDNLLNLCSQLSVSTNHYISNNTNLDTPWETFCSAGYCVQTKAEDENNNYILQNYPNPFSTSTTIEYNIPESATSPTLDIFDVSGKLMHSQSINQTGTGTIEIQAGTLAPGVYHYRLSMGDAISATKRMVIMK